MRFSALVFALSMSSAVVSAAPTIEHQARDLETIAPRDSPSLLSTVTVLLGTVESVLGILVTGDNAPANDLKTLEGDIGTLTTTLTGAVTSLDGFVGTLSDAVDNGVTSVDGLLGTLKDIVTVVGTVLGNLE